MAGFIFAGLENSLGRWKTVLVVGLLFGGFHLSIYRIVPMALLGMVITFAVWQTRSILAGAEIHFTSNALVDLSSQYPILADIMGIQDGRAAKVDRFAVFGLVLAFGLHLLYLCGGKDSPSISKTVDR